MELSHDEFSAVSPRPLPTAMFSLIAGAVATFDADRDASRRYLQRASMLLRAQREELQESVSSCGTTSYGCLATWQVTRLLDYVEMNLSQKITLCDLARVILVSREKLCRGFKAGMGVSPSRFIILRRMELARVMLRTTQDTITQIAISCGLYDHAHFCRVFRRATGASPSAWRRAHAVAPGAATPSRTVPPDLFPVTTCR